MGLKMISEIKFKEFIKGLKRRITKMEKDGHVLPRRNLYHAIDLEVKKWGLK